MTAPSKPLSPDPVTRAGDHELPAYISNGVIGLRILDCPFLPAPVLVSGLAGVEPDRRIEAAAEAPYPIGADVQLNGVWLRASPQQIAFREQRYDFSTAEVTTTFTFEAAGATATFEVLSFASKAQPMLVLQETTVTVSEGADVVLRPLIDCSRIAGTLLRRTIREQDSPPSTGWDGALCWETNGGLASCGVAIATELVGASRAERSPVEGCDRRHGGHGSPVSRLARPPLPNAADRGGRAGQDAPGAGSPGHPHRGPRELAGLREAARRPRAGMGGVVARATGDHRR